MPSENKNGIIIIKIISFIFFLVIGVIEKILNFKIKKKINKNSKKKGVVSLSKKKKLNIIIVYNIVLIK